MAILTNAGRAAMALAIKDTPVFVAWGTGSDSWDDETERESRQSTELTHELGRVKAKAVGFCTPDPAGDIVMQGNRYAPSATPTPNLHIKAEFDFNDGLGQTIREIGVFVNVVLVKGLPRGQKYFTPDNVENKGILLGLDHIVPMQRGVGSRFGLDFVISF